MKQVKLDRESATNSAAVQSPAPKGIYRDVLRGPEGVILFDSGWHSNKIVNNCRRLLAGFIKDAPATQSVRGIQHLSVGQGRKDWDGSPPPEPPDETLALETPYSEPIPADMLKIEYLDEDGQPSEQITAHLQITATLGPGYPPPVDPLKTYPLREFGLFGKAGDEFFMINVVRHPVIHKDENAILTRTLQLRF